MSRVTIQHAWSARQLYWLWPAWRGFATIGRALQRLAVSAREAKEWMLKLAGEMP